MFSASLRVLVVDDEEIIADSLSKIIQVAGHCARPAYSAQHAIHVAPEFAPNVLITDVMMPGMNGVNLARYLKGQYPNCAVLLISGNAETMGLLEDAKRAGECPEFMPKPVHPRRILEFLAKWVAVPDSRGTPSQDAVGAS